MAVRLVWAVSLQTQFMAGRAHGLCDEGWAQKAWKVLHVKFGGR